MIEATWVGLPIGPEGYIKLDMDLSELPARSCSARLNDESFPNGGAPPDGVDPVVCEHDPGAQDALHQGANVHAFALGPEVVSLTAGEYLFAPSPAALARLAEGATASSPTPASAPPPTAA